MNIPTIFVFLSVFLCFSNAHSFGIRESSKVNNERYIAKSENKLPFGAARNSAQCTCACTDIASAALQCVNRECHLQLCPPTTPVTPPPTTRPPTTAAQVPTTRTQARPNNCFGGKRRFLDASREAEFPDPCPDNGFGGGKTVLEDMETPELLGVDHQANIQFRCC